MKMQNSRPLTTPDGEVRDDLTDEELARFRPANEVLPPSLLAKLRGRKDFIPFGPFIALGAWVALLYGREILSWYWGFWI